VVDYTNLGGIEQGCGAGSIARAVLTSAGYSLAGGPGGPDTVCRVNGVPAAGEECWGRTQDHWYIFVARQGGAWNAATVGIDSLRLKPGDSVALVWEGTTTQRSPGVAAAKPVTATKPSATAVPSKAATAKPTAKATAKKPKATKSAGSVTTAATPTQASSSAAAASSSPSASASGSTAAGTTSAAPGQAASTSGATTAPSASGSATSDTSTLAGTATASSGTGDSSDSGGVPAWLLIVVVGVLAGASSVVAWRRKQLR